MDGDTCYGCRGNGETLTKKGRAAHLYYKGLITVMVKDVQEGDTIIDCGTRRRVVGLGVDARNDCLVIMTTRVELHLHAETTVLRLPTAERKEILMAEALTYQGMLTKQGKLMKKYQEIKS